MSSAEQQVTVNIPSVTKIPERQNAYQNQRDIAESLPIRTISYRNKLRAAAAAHL